MKEHWINHQNNFICGWYFDEPSVCNALIDHHKTSPYKQTGKSYNTSGSTKKSTDVSLQDRALLDQYFAQLQKCVDLYVNKYPLCNTGSPWRVTTPPNIQHYECGESFSGWHCERCFLQEPSISRHLVFMTYLNDVTEGGETEFFYQKAKIKPEKGLTLIWGSDWTFTHRGIPSDTQEKYIVTGWFNYVAT